MKRIQRISDLERQYVNQVLDGEFKSAMNYSFVSRLENEFAKKFNARYGIAMVNGTATLHASLEAVGIGDGDEVICPALTMSSTHIAVLQANAIPVFADIDPRTFNITADTIAKVITDKTKAIIPVALYGLSPDMDSIMELADKYDLIVIEDDAECFLGYYKGRIAGSTAHMSSFSFQSSKHMTAGEGGIVVTNDEELALSLRRFSGLGYGNIGPEKGRITKDEIQSPMFERHVSLGFNYRLSDLCGAVALAQLERIEELVEMRVLSAKHYLNAIENFSWIYAQHVPEEYVNSYWAFTVCLDTDRVSWQNFRKKFIELGGDGIYGAWKIGYLEPMYRNRAFHKREKLIEKHGLYKYEKGLCPIAEQLQPKLLQFKTNYWDESDAYTQAQILKKTCEYFNRKV